MDERQKNISEYFEGTMKVLVSGRANFRRRAAEWLGHHGNKKAVPHLIVALNDAHEEVRWKAAMALGEILDRRAIPALSSALKDKSSNVRNEAFEAIVKITNVEEFQALVRRYEDARSIASLWWIAAHGLQSTLHKLESIYSGFDNRESVEEFEAKLHHAYFKLKKKGFPKEALIIIQKFYAELKQRVAKCRNGLAQDKGIILNDKPKPPKKSKVYQQIRRSANG